MMYDYSSVRCATFLKLDVTAISDLCIQVVHLQCTDSATYDKCIL